MQEQNYQNHVRFHPMFHYVVVPMAMIVLIGAVFNLFPPFRGGMELWFAIILLIAALALVMAVMLIRTYANKVQNRVVRVEENFRHYLLTGKPLDARLTLAQIIALRFASDEEFAGLCTKAVQENQSSDSIKKSIQSWKSDFLRV